MRTPFFPARNDGVMQAAHNGVLALAVCTQWLVLLLFISGSQQRTEVQEHSRCITDSPRVLRGSSCLCGSQHGQHVPETHLLRDFLPKCMLNTCKTKQFCETRSKNVTGRHDPTRHESAIYIAGTILKLQNTMELHQQRVHKKQVKTVVTMEGRFEHDPNMTRDRPETVVPQSLTCKVRRHPLY